MTERAPPPATPASRPGSAEAADADPARGLPADPTATPTTAADDLAALEPAAVAPPGADSSAADVPAAQRPAVEPPAVEPPAADPPAAAHAALPPVAAPVRSRLSRWSFFVLGWLMLILGGIGAVLPVMPTTIFLILGAGCFARSSPKLEQWILNHPRFGRGVRDWQARGAIAPRGKRLAVMGMTLGYAIFWLGARPGWGLGLLVAAFMLACAIYVVTRPS